MLKPPSAGSLALTDLLDARSSALGRAQARALGYPDLPIAVIPHPFGIRTREEVRALAAHCVDDIARLLSRRRRRNRETARDAAGTRGGASKSPDDLDAFNRAATANAAGATACRSCRRRAERVAAHAAAHARAGADEIVARSGAGLRRRHRRAHRHQRGDGRLRAGIPAGADRRGRGDRRPAHSICRAFRRPPIRPRCG